MVSISLLKTVENSSWIWRVLSKTSLWWPERRYLKWVSKQLVRLRGLRLKLTLEEVLTKLVSITLMILSLRWVISKGMTKWKKNLINLLTELLSELRKPFSLMKSLMSFKMILKCWLMKLQLKEERLTVLKWPQEHSLSLNIVIWKEFLVSNFILPNLIW